MLPKRGTNLFLIKISGENVRWADINTTNFHFTVSPLKNKVPEYVSKLLNHVIFSLFYTKLKSDVVLYKPLYTSFIHDENIHMVSTYNGYKNWFTELSVWHYPLFVLFCFDRAITVFTAEFASSDIN